MFDSTFACPPFSYTIRLQSRCPPCRQNDGAEDATSNGDQEASEEEEEKGDKVEEKGEQGDEEETWKEEASDEKEQQ